MNWLWFAVVVGVLAPAPAMPAGPPPSAPPARVIPGVGPDAIPDAIPDAAPAIEPEEAAGWAWPLSPRPAVIHRFAPPAQRWLAGHRGVDLAAAVGQPVLAPADGVVTFVGRVAGRPVVSLRHGGGPRSTYEPVAAAVAAGSAVRTGDVIGYLSGEPGHCAPAACLHWGALHERTYVDPLALIGRAPIILLPAP